MLTYVLVPDIRFSVAPTAIEHALYMVGWLVWTPSYVVAVWFLYLARPQRHCLIPTIAVCGNITFELYWFLFGDFTFVPIVRWIYLGAFLLDIPILFGAFRYGTFGKPIFRATNFRPKGRPRTFANAVATQRRLDRSAFRIHTLILLGVLLAWLALYVGLRYSFEVPLGSVGAYLDNAVMSGLFVWQTWENP